MLKYIAFFLLLAALLIYTSAFHTDNSSDRWLLAKVDVNVYEDPVYIAGDGHALCVIRTGEKVRVVDEVYLKDAMNYKVRCKDGKVGFVLHGEEVSLVAGKTSSE